LDFFSKLGDTIERCWQETGRDHAAFAAIAARCVSDNPPAEYVATDEVIHTVCKATSLAAQRNLRSPFGQPPLTVYAGTDFYIELLFWVDSTTSIHQHAFSGAFHVLEGSSVETRYRFDVGERLSPGLATGRLEPLGVKHLTRGCTERIDMGPGFIHSLFHLHRPSVSVVVRTDRDPAAPAQFNYSAGGFAYDPFFDDALLVRKMQILEMLERTGNEGRFERAFEAIAPASPHAAFSLLGAAKSDDPRFEALLERLREAHPEVTRCFSAHLAEQARERAIISLRSAIRVPEHRFLLALLLTVPRRTDVLKIIGQAHPKTPPADTIVRWLSELANESFARFGNRYLPSAQLDETTLVVFRTLLDGLSDADALLHLEAEFGTEQVRQNRAELLELILALRGSVLFRNLLRAPCEESHAH